MSLLWQKWEKWLPGINTGVLLHESVYAMAVSWAKINSKVHSEMTDWWTSLARINYSFHVYI